MTRKHAIATAGAITLATALCLLVATSSYDWQAIKLVLLRITLWFLAVTFYGAAKSLLQDDDDEADWSRINGGNTAVAVYRGAEYSSVCIAVAMLVAKI